MRLLHNNGANPKRLVTAEAIQSEEPALRFRPGALLFFDSGRLFLAAGSLSVSESASDGTPLLLVDSLPVLAKITGVFDLTPT